MIKTLASYELKELYERFHRLNNCIFDKCKNDTKLYHLDGNVNKLLTNLVLLCDVHSDEFFKNPLIKVTKEFTFDSCHKLNDYDGPCSRLHGHTYKLQITIKGRLINKTGMVIDFSDLKKDVNKYIIDVLDHYYLNDIFVFNPTAENMLIWIWNILEREALIKGLYNIKLWETPTSFAELCQDDIYDFDINGFSKWI